MRGSESRPFRAFFPFLPFFHRAQKAPREIQKTQENIHYPPKRETALLPAVPPGLCPALSPAPRVSLAVPPAISAEAWGDSGSGGPVAGQGSCHFGLSSSWSFGFLDGLSPCQSCRRPLQTAFEEGAPPLTWISRGDPTSIPTM